MKKQILTLISALLVVSQWVLAADDFEARLTDSLRKVIPDAEITSIKQSDLPGLYEIMMGVDVIYMSEDGRFVFRGDLYDLQKRLNVSKVRRYEARVLAFADLYPDQLIEFAPKGETRHVVYVYTDIDCTYCRKLHKGVEYLNDHGVAVRYLAFPRAGIGSKAYKTMVSAWCSDDPKQALTDAKLGKAIPSLVCDAPVEKHFNLGREMNVRGTPAIFLESGQELGGYIPPEELVKHLDGKS